MNTALLAALAGALIVAGALGVIAGMRPVPPRPPRPVKPSGTGLAARLQATSPRWRILGAAGLAGGIAVTAISGWALALIVVPAAAFGLPWLLSAPRPDIAQLEALQEWTRALAGVLGEGQSLEQAIPGTLRSTPPAIEPQVRRLVSRLRAGWLTTDALKAFGDELATTTGDLVVSKLILASRRRGDGLVQALRDVAASAADDVSARRRIEADRSKPRSNARFVTLISAATIAFLSLSGSTYMAPYRTPFGQLLLALLLVLYVAILIWLRQMAAGRPEPRFLVQGAHGPHTAAGGRR